MAFDLIGALVSHLAVGDPMADAVPPVAVLGLVVASWALRPPSRRVNGAAH